MALLLGPPSSGKTTLLLALSGKLDHELKVPPCFPISLYFSISCVCVELLFSFYLYDLCESIINFIICSCSKLEE